MILLIIIILLIFFILWIYTSYLPSKPINSSNSINPSNFINPSNSINLSDQEDPIVPTMHGPCTTNCGTETLICDPLCHRCRATLNAPCSSNIDCQSGLHCVQYKCVKEPEVGMSNLLIENRQSSTSKKVHWDF
jgi:hypothetical protein